MCVCVCFLLTRAHWTFVLSRLFWRHNHRRAVNCAFVALWTCDAHQVITPIVRLANIVKRRHTKRILYQKFEFGDVRVANFPVIFAQASCWVAADKCRG